MGSLTKSQGAPKLIIIEAGTCKFIINSLLFHICLKFSTIGKLKGSGESKYQKRKGRKG